MVVHHKCSMAGDALCACLAEWAAVWPWDPECGHVNMPAACFEVEPLACPSCRGTMRVVAFITQASVIDEVLTNLSTRAVTATHAAPRSPPSTPAPPASRSPGRAPGPSADAPASGA